MLRGIAASAGVGAGRAVVVKQQEIVVHPKSISDWRAEQQRFFHAVGAFCAEALSVYHTVRERIGEKEAAIITAQIVLVTDPELHKEVVDTIRRDNISADFAFGAVCDQYIELFQSMKDELMQSRASDFRDVRVRLLNILQGRKRAPKEIPQGSVLVADDIAPSMAATVCPKKISAIVTQSGSVYSHIVLIAHALRIPVVVAVEQLLDTIGEGDFLLVDGDNGRVIKDPEPANPDTHHSKGKVTPMIAGLPRKRTLGRAAVNEQ